MCFVKKVIVFGLLLVFTSVLYGANKDKLPADMACQAGLTTQDDLNNALILALADANPERVKELIDANADVNAKFKTIEGHASVEMAQNLKVKDGDTALYWAIHSQQFEIFDDLLERGANPNTVVRGMAILSFAYSRGGGYPNPFLNRLLARPDIDINARGQGMLNWTLLNFAIAKNDLALAQRLFDTGQNVVDSDNHHDKYLHTDLTYNNKSGDARMMELLIENGVDVNADDPFLFHHNFLYSALYNLASRSHILTEIEKKTLKAKVRVLIKHTKDINETNSTGQAPYLHYAVATFDLDILEWLREANADINALDEHREPPIAIAIKENETEIVGWFLEKGADMTSFGYRQVLVSLLQNEFWPVYRNMPVLQNGVRYDTLEEFARSQGMNIPQ